MNASAPLRPLFVFLSLLGVAGLFMLMSQQVYARHLEVGRPGATITVNTIVDELNNDGDCSLREAVIAANTNASVDMCSAGNGADTIIVPSGVYTLTLIGEEDEGAIGDLDILEAVTIEGAGAGQTLIKNEQLIYPARHNRAPNGGGVDPVFQILSDTNNLVTLRALAVENGLLGIRSAVGSNVRLDNVSIQRNYKGMDSGGTLEVIDSTFQNNFVWGSGAGLSTSGSTTIENSLFYNNLSYSLGEPGDAVNGAAWIHTGSAAATINNSSFVGNGWTEQITATGTGAAIYAQTTVIATNITFGGHRAEGLFNTPELVAGPVHLRNSILVTTAQVPLGCSAQVISLGYNLSTGTDCSVFTEEGDVQNVSATDLVLQPLAGNGGATWTMALGVGSVAIDTGTLANCPATDQRGFARPQDGDGSGDGQCDRGAFEAPSIPALPTGTPTSTATATTTPTATATGTVAPETTPTPTVTATGTVAPETTPTPTVTATVTGVPEITPTPTVTATPTTAPTNSLFLPFVQKRNE